MTDKKKVTIKEVATSAGVSVGTVSRVLAKMNSDSSPTLLLGRFVPIIWT